ncbi:MAG: hypothetical protein KF858_05770 [Candidatus Sumerlaeia bacterium]|nr:hypothetical protein [Candidatus Sumerlaeia bacterium]
MDELSFQKLGGTYHMVLMDDRDLGRLHELDPARWVATSVPVRDFRCDDAFLKFLDVRQNGRILVSHVLEARDWMLGLLDGRSHLGRKGEILHLEDLGSGADAAALKATALRVLRESHAENMGELSLSALRAYRTAFIQSLANGDGVVPPEVIEDADAAAFARDIVAVLGGSDDLSGRKGVSAADVDTFLARAQAYDAWLAEGKSGDALNPDVFPWGEDTAPCAGLVDGIDAKVEQFFWQCDLVREEPGAAARFRLADDQLRALHVEDPAAIEAHLKEAPLAPPNADGLLHLSEQVNSWYAARMADVTDRVIRRALGRHVNAITREQWRQVKAKFAAWRGYVGRTPAEPFDKVPAERRDAEKTEPLAARLRELIALDAEAAPELAQLSSLERLILYQRWLLEFVNNFASLAAIYDARVRTLFERGSMVIDGRRLEFTVQVFDRAAHKAVASQSKMFIAYAVVSEKDGTPLFEVAAPVTRGERGRLVAGKRGIFETLDGKVYDATIVETLENPISVPESMMAPFRRTAAFIEKKIEEFAAKRAASAESGLQAKATAPPTAPAADAAPKKDPMMMVGLMAGGGVAIAAVGSMAAYVVSVLTRISMLDIVLALLGVVLVIALFAGFLGWLTLRKRDLGPFLEASGWAVNPRMRISGPLARVFNRRPALPKGHRVTEPVGTGLADEDPEPQTGRLLVLIGILAIVAYIAWNVFKAGWWGTN